MPNIPYKTNESNAVCSKRPKRIIRNIPLKKASNKWYIEEHLAAKVPQLRKDKSDTNNAHEFPKRIN